MQTVGQLLQAEREKRGLSIKDIEKATSIRSLYIDAIEHDNYSVIPGEVYLKGFIRNYGNYLGLDGVELVNLYRQSKLPPIPQNANTPKNEPQNAGSSSQHQDKPRSIVPFVAIIVVGLAIGGAFFWMSSSGQSNLLPKSQNAKPTPTAPVTPPSITPASPPAPIAKPVQAKPIVVIANFREECWVSVQADGRLVFEGMSSPGARLNWEAEKNMLVKLGNAGGVDMVYNGQDLGKLGSKGEVVVKAFTAEKRTN